MTLQTAGQATILTWDHYDSAALDEMQREFNRALQDIGERLVQRFGGKVLERFVQETSR